MRIPTKTFTDEERDEAHIKKILNENKTNKKKFLVTEETKMDWWDKFIKGLKEGRISIWIWIIIIIGMLFSFSFSTINIDFSVNGDFDYKHPEIFQSKGDLND